MSWSGNVVDARRTALAPLPVLGVGVGIDQGGKAAVRLMPVCGDMLQIKPTACHQMCGGYFVDASYTRKL